MFNRDKYAEYLDSATIYNFLHGMDPKVSKKVKSLKLRSPWYGLGTRSFDHSYASPGTYIIRNTEENSIIRIGHSQVNVRESLYLYLNRLPKSISQNLTCGIINTQNGEHKELSKLFSEVIEFESLYHDYFMLKSEIENPPSIVDISKLKRVYPYTGGTYRGNKEWALRYPHRISGVYFIWKDEVLDYVGMGTQGIKRLYHHFFELKKPDRERAHCLFYPKEDVQTGRIKIAFIPVYRKMVNAKVFDWDEDNLRPENRSEYTDRILDLEKRLIWDHDPKVNGPTARGYSKSELSDFEKLSNEENKSQINDVVLDDDPPF